MIIHVFIVYVIYCFEAIQPKKYICYVAVDNYDSNILEWHYAELPYFIALYKVKTNLNVRFATKDEYKNYCQLYFPIDCY